METGSKPPTTNDLSKKPEGAEATAATIINNPQPAPPKKTIFASDIEFDETPHAETSAADQDNAEEVKAEEEKPKADSGSKKEFERLSTLIVDGIAGFNMNFLVPIHDQQVLSAYSHEVAAEYLKKSIKMDKGEAVTLTDSDRAIISSQTAYYKAAKWDEAYRKELAEKWNAALGGADVQMSPFKRLMLSMTIAELPLVVPLLLPKVKSFFKGLFGTKAIAKEATMSQN